MARYGVPFGGLVFGTQEARKVEEYKLIYGTDVSVKNLKLGEPTMKPFYWASMANCEYFRIGQSVGEEKALKAFSLHGGQPIVVEAMMMFIKRLSGFPGPYTGDLNSPEARRMLVSHTHQLRHEEPDNTAVVVGVLAVHDPIHGTQTRLAMAPGTIPISPNGKYNFEWDEIFVPDDSHEHLTYASMGIAKKCQMSARWKLVEALARKPFLISSCP